MCMQRSSYLLTREEWKARLVEMKLSGELDRADFGDRAVWLIGPCESCTQFCSVKVTGIVTLYCSCGPRAAFIDGEIVPACDSCKTVIGSSVRNITGHDGHHYNRLTCACGMMIARI